MPQNSGGPLKAESSGSPRGGETGFPRPDQHLGQRQGAFPALMDKTHLGVECQQRRERYPPAGERWRYARPACRACASGRADFCRLPGTSAGAISLTSAEDSRSAYVVSAPIRTRGPPASMKHSSAIRLASIRHGREAVVLHLDDHIRAPGDDAPVRLGQQAADRSAEVSALKNQFLPSGFPLFIKSP